MHKYPSNKITLKSAQVLHINSLTSRIKAPQDIELQANQFIIKNENQQMKTPSLDQYSIHTKRSDELTPQNQTIFANRQPIISMVSHNTEQKEDVATSQKNKKTSSLGLLRNKQILLSVAKNKENIKLHSPKQSQKSSHEQIGVQSTINKSILLKPQQANQAHQKQLSKNVSEQNQKQTTSFQMNSDIIFQYPKMQSIKELKKNLNTSNQQAGHSSNENKYRDSVQSSLIIKNQNTLGLNIQVSKVSINKQSQIQEKVQKKQTLSLYNPLFYTSIDGSGLSLTRQTSLDFSQDYRLASPQIQEQIHFRQFSNASDLLCNQSQETNQIYQQKENEVSMIERNHQVSFSSLPISSGQLHNALKGLTKKQGNYEDDCFVPSELQNQQQMNSNINKLQKMETVRASDIDFLNSKEGSSQQNNSFESQKNSIRSISTYSQLELNNFDWMNSEESAVKRNNHRRNNSGIVNTTISLCKKRSKSKIFQEGNSFQELSRQSSEKKIVKQLKEQIKVDDIDNKELSESIQDIDEKNVPQTFMSLEKQSTLSIQHKNKFTRRNCTCDNDVTKIGSCIKVKSWLAMQKGDVEQRENKTKGSPEIDEKLMGQIQKDVERTHQSHEFFWSPHVQLSIQHILCKFAMQFPEAGTHQIQKYQLLFKYNIYQQGYVQGMNLIAGLFVWHGDEVSSLQLFNCASSKLNFVELFKPGFPGLLRHLKIIEVLTILNCPEMFSIMARFELTLQMFISEWILVLFSDIIPLEYSHLVIEGIFEEGWIFFYRVTLNILKIMLLSVHKLQDSGEILLTLKSLKYKQEEHKIDWVALLKCKQPYISDILIEQLASHMLMNKSQTDPYTIQQY